MKIRVIHYLLILCLGVLPLGSNYAANADHDDLMSDNCGGCDIDTNGGHDACDGELCLSVSGHCGFGCSLPALAATAVEHSSVATAVTRLDLLEPQFFSHLVFSIYRPPIT
ncbi:MAG: hypothetical protein GY802_09625 [Gammaproteobacteria bacterium]|nr:hypothetical protein [Gammaproteobacteria bacterium]